MVSCLKQIVRNVFNLAVPLAALASASPTPPLSDAAAFHFRIRVVDGETGRGVPLVLLRTSDYVQQYSDSAGNMAFFEPGFMDQPVWFSVLADGYELNRDLSLNPTMQMYESPYDSGVVLMTTSGGNATVAVTRLQPAELVYRLTGGGLYRDSVLTGDLQAIPQSAIKRAVLDARSGSIGQDTLQLATYKGNVLWLFGDTACPRSARQNNCESTGMHTVGAQSCVPGGSAVGCDAASPPELKYFGEESPPGFHHPHPIAPIEPLEQNTWIAALSVLDKGMPSEALFAAYYKNPGDGGGEGPPAQGMAKWNDDLSQLVKVGEDWPTNASLSLNGAHAVQRLSPSDAASTPRYVWYCNGAVNSRVPAKASAMADYSQFEMLPDVESEWSCDTVNWNDWAGRYVCVGSADAGSGSNQHQSIAFSHSLTGPYVNGSLVASHAASGSSCYNALHMPHMDLEGGREIFFACTYTAMWSNTNLGRLRRRPATSPEPNLWGTCLFGLNSRQGCAPVAPRYEYNNLVYRIDLGRILDHRWVRASCEMAGAEAAL